MLNPSLDCGKDAIITAIPTIYPARINCLKNFSTISISMNNRVNPVPYVRVKSRKLSLNTSFTPSPGGEGERGVRLMKRSGE
jgi:hypothetical protein